MPTEQAQTSNGDSTRSESQTDQLLETIGALLEGDLDITPSSLVDLVLQVTAAYGEQRPIIRAITTQGPVIGTVIGADLAPIIASFIAAISSARQDSVLRGALRTNDAVTAERDIEKLSAWVMVGFSRKEAFALLMQSKAPSSISSAATSSAQSARKAATNRS